MGNIERADVDGNTSVNCCNGYFVRTEGYSTAINIRNTYSLDCQRGFEFASCSNVYASFGNIITLKTIPDYVITSQYDAIMEWGLTVHSITCMDGRRCRRRSCRECYLLPGLD